MPGCVCTQFSVVFSLSFAFDSAHRDLLSFPTRRSSDLFAPCRFDRGDFGVPFHRHGQARPNVGEAHVPKRYAVSDGLVRSEEHTSELQSRRDLVCRLLLEKKKTWPESISHIEPRKPWSL